MRRGTYFQVGTVVKEGLLEDGSGGNEFKRLGFYFVKKRPGYTQGTSARSKTATMPINVAGIDEHISIYIYIRTIPRFCSEICTVAFSSTSLGDMRLKPQRWTVCLACHGSATQGTTPSGEQPRSNSELLLLLIEFARRFT